MCCTSVATSMKAISQVKSDRDAPRLDSIRNRRLDSHDLEHVHVSGFTPVEHVHVSGFTRLEHVHVSGFTRLEHVYVSRDSYLGSKGSAI